MNTLLLKSNTSILVIKKLSILLFFFISIIHVNAQLDPQTDLENALTNVLNSEERCSLYYEIAEQYFEDWELDLARKNYQIAFQLAKENDNQVMQSRSLLSIASCYQDLSIPDSALLFNNKALEVIKNNNTKEALEEKSNIHSQLGLLYYAELSDTKTALQHYFLSLEFANKTQNPQKIADAYKGLVLIYSVIDHSKCMRYGREGIKIAKQNNSLFTLAELQRTMANSIIMNESKTKDSEKINKNELNNALKLINESISFYQNNNNTFELADCWLIFGNYYLLMGQLDLSLEYTQKSFDLFSTLDSETAIISAGIDLANVLYKKEKYQEAILLLEQFSDSPVLEKNIEFLNLVSDKLSSCYEKIGQYDKAFYILKSLKASSKDYYKKNWDKNSLELSIKYNTEWLEEEKILLEERNQYLQFRNQIATWLVISFLLLLLTGAWLFQKMKLKNQKIEDQKIELQTLNSTKNKLFSIIAHDLRSPLISLQGISEKFNYLINNNRTKDIYHLSHSIESSIENVNKLIDNLLHWALVEQGHFPHHPVTINVAEAIDDVIRLYQNRADSKNIQLTWDVSKELFAHADKNAITTVFRNLTDNAIKFTGDNGPIHFLAKTENNHIVINIEDTGIGIPNNELNVLLAMNELKTKEGTAGEKGTGLGLVLCKELIEMNAGSLDIKSKEGKGSIFSVYLPTHKTN